MSHDAHAPAAASGGFDIGGALHELISPRENAVAPTIIENVADVAKTTWQLAKKATGTAIDMPLGLAELVSATTINSAGTITTMLDKGITQPINAVRAKIHNVLAV